MSFGGFNFGNSSTAQPAQQPQAQSSVPSFSFTGATPNPTPPATGAPAQTSSLFNFGSQPASNTAQQPQAGGSLFGGAAGGQQAGQPSSGGFNFGAKPAATTGQTSGGGLFGSSNTAPTAPGTSLFGQPAQNQQHSGTSSGGLFGSASQNQNTVPSAGGGLFGQSTQQQPSGGLFGTQSATQPQQQGAGPSLFASQASSRPGLQASTSGQTGALTKAARFSELPEGHQKTIEQLDSWIKQQKAAGQGIDTENMGKAIWRTSSDVKSSSEESAALTQSLTQTMQSLQALQQRSRVEEQDLQQLGEIWNTYKSVDGRPGAMRVAGHREWPGDFFLRVARSLEERAERYKKTIGQLKRVVEGLSHESDTPSSQAVAQTIQNHQTAIIQLAAQLERLQSRMNDLRSIYAAEYREQTNSLRDPFDVAREEKGLAPLRSAVQ